MSIPTETALYRFFDADGDLLYVGISVAPWARWKQHKAEKVWWQLVGTIKIELHPDRRSALLAERVAIIAEKPRYNIVHNGKRPTMERPTHHGRSGDEGRWHFQTREHGYERESDLFLQPEPNGLAVLCDYYDDELDDQEVIAVYLEWLRRHHKGSLASVPIFWSVVGDGICEVAPHAEHGFPDGRSFLTYFTRPVDVETGERCSFYRLPIRHRFPRFWEAFGYQPAPLQPYLPLAQILGMDV